MESARKVGMKRVFVGKEMDRFCNADLYVSNLFELSKLLKKAATR